MPKMIDLAEVEAQLTEMFARTATESEKPGYEGVVARCQLALLPAITRWRADEFNRGVDANTILNAMTGMCASTILGEVCVLTVDEDAQITIINKVLQGIGEEIASMMKGSVREHGSKLIEAGRA